VHLDLLLHGEEVHADAALEHDLRDAGDRERQRHRDHADVGGPERELLAPASRRGLRPVSCGSA
jgi:hypothetical protein